MILQDWMVIIAGNTLVDAITAETQKRVQHETLPRVQERQFRRGIVGAEVVKSLYGYSVRYDSGLQNFNLLASARAGQLDGTLEDAERFARDWVAQDPAHRYAWRRKETPWVR